MVLNQKQILGEDAQRNQSDVLRLEKSMKALERLL
jgi:hypothetical protein